MWGQSILFTPASGQSGSTFGVTVTGMSTSFISASVTGVQLNGPMGSNVSLTGISVNSATQLTGTLSLPLNIQPGLYDGEVQGVFNSYNCTGCFQVNLAPITIDAMKVDALLMDNVVPDGQVNPGEIIRYTVTIDNPNTSPNAQNSIFTSGVDPNTTLVVGSVTTTQGTVTMGNTVGDNSVTVDIGIIPTSSTVTVVFDAQVNSPFPQMVSSVSCQGNVTGTDFSTNTYDPSLGPTSPTITPISNPLPIITALKNDVLINEILVDGNANEGESIRYDVVIGNNPLRLPAQDVLFTSAVDPNTTLQAGSVTTSQGTVTMGNTMGDNSVEVNIGVIPASSTVMVSFTVDIKSPFPFPMSTTLCQGIVSGSNFSNVNTDDPATGFGGDPTITDIVDAPPVLSASKTDALINDSNGNGLANPGETLRYTASITNIGTGLNPNNVQFTSGIDPNTSLVVGSVTTSQGSVTMGNTAGDNSVLVDIGTIPASSTVSVTFDVLINDPFPMAVSTTSCQGQFSGSNFNTINTDDPDVGGAEDPTETQIYHLLNATLTDTHFTDPNMNGLPDPGETILYTLTVNNPIYGSIANGIVAMGTPDPSTMLTIGSVTTSQGTVTEGNTGGDMNLGVDIGTMNPGESVIITYEVTLNTPYFPPSAQLVHQVDISGSNFNSFMSDDPDFGGTDDPTTTLVNPAAIPTLGQWMIIILGLLLMIIGIRVIQSREILITQKMI